MVTDGDAGGFDETPREQMGPLRQAERNLYLPQPNYLAHWGGAPIDGAPSKHRASVAFTSFSAFCRSEPLAALRASKLDKVLVAAAAEGR